MLVDVSTRKLVFFSDAVILPSRSTWAHEKARHDGRAGGVGCGKLYAGGFGARRSARGLLIRLSESAARGLTISVFLIRRSVVLKPRPRASKPDSADERTSLERED